MSKFRVLIALAFMAVGSATSANAQIVTDGGFEAQVVSGFKYGPVTPSWAFVNGSGLINGFNTGFDTPAPLAGQGYQVVFLQSLPGQPTGSISTLITLPTTGSYFLSFLSAGRAFDCCGGNATIDVLLGSQQIGQFSTVTGEAWSSKGATFTASAGTYALTFAGGTPLPGDNTTFIDNVSIEGSPELSITATPEPASMALFATGLFSFAGFAVRRKRRA